MSERDWPFSFSFSSRGKVPAFRLSRGAPSVCPGLFILHYFLHVILWSYTGNQDAIYSILHEEIAKSIRFSDIARSNFIIIFGYMLIDAKIVNAQMKRRDLFFEDRGKNPRGFTLYTTILPRRGRSADEFSGISSDIDRVPYPTIFSVLVAWLRVRCRRYLLRIKSSALSSEEEIKKKKRQSTAREIERRRPNFSAGTSHAGPYETQIENSRSPRDYAAYRLSSRGRLPRAQPRQLVTVAFPRERTGPLPAYTLAVRRAVEDGFPYCQYFGQVRHSRDRNKKRKRKKKGKYRPPFSSTLVSQVENRKELARLNPGDDGGLRSGPPCVFSPRARAFVAAMIVFAHRSR